MSDAPRPPGSTGWRTGSAYGGEIAGPSRGARRVVAVLALLAVAGAVAGAFFWIGVADPPVLLTLSVGEYSDPAWPPNPWAEEDSDALQAALPYAAGQEKAYIDQEKSRLQKKLAGLATVKSKQSVVLHLSALAMTRGGVIYILPGDARQGDPDSWLPLAAVLDLFAACNSKNKLLLLDLAHPIVDPLRGPLAETVSDRLDEELGRRELPFYVLTSCSKGELSLPMDEEQQSAFAFYIADGLRGAADGFGPNGRVNDQIHVRELTEFVIDHVSRWARDCRGERQTPHLYGNGDDFELTTRRMPPAEEPGGRAYPDWLLAGWKKRDEWLNKEAVYRGAPAAFNLLSTTLPRAERDWQAAGRADHVERFQKNLNTEIGKAEKERDQAKIDRPPQLKSITTWSAPPMLPDWAVKIDDFLNERSAGATNPMALEKAKTIRTELVAKASASEDSRKTAAVLIWRRLMSDAAPRPETVIDLSALLDELQPTGTTESAAVRRLAQWQRPGGKLLPAAARQYLHTEDAANRALAAATAGFPWVKSAFTAAAKLRDAGEQQFFEGRTRDEQSQAVETLKQAEFAFVATARQLDIILAARAAVEDAAVVLPASVGRVTEEGGTPLRVWQDAVQATIELFVRLAPGDSGGKELPLEEWESATGRLSLALQRLRADYQPSVIKRRVDDLGDPKAGRPGRAQDHDMLAALLRSPLLLTAERKRVWDAYKGIGEKMNEQNRDADQADDDAHRRPASARPAPQRLRDENDRRDRRAQVSIELLRVAGLDKVEVLETQRQAALADTGPKWEALATALRTAWTVRLPEQARLLGDQKTWPAADRRERFLSPGTAPTDRKPAAYEVRRRDQVEYLGWLEDYYRGLMRTRKDAPKAAALYEDAAKDCAEARRAISD
jgi:hypothetical protein